MVRIRNGAWGCSVERQNFVLAALSSAGRGAQFTPVQVQKLFFLVDREASHLFGGPYYQFTPYDYGPFDRNIYTDLELLQMQGAVEVVNSGRYRVYRLTENGAERGERLLQNFSTSSTSYLAQIAGWVRSLSFGQLVSAIYSKYPEMRENSVFQG